MTNTILAIDLGKFNSVLCHFDTGMRQASVRTANGEYRMVDEGSRSVAHASGSYRHFPNTEQNTPIDLTPANRSV